MTEAGEVIFREIHRWNFTIDNFYSELEKKEANAYSLDEWDEDVFV